MNVVIIGEFTCMLCGTAIYGLKDRGTIAVGAHADLLLFDPQVRFDSPGG
jgi:N-acyl-D-aspartate/D-glutamate deacylase